MFDLILLAMLLTGPKHGYRLKKQAGLILGQSDLHNNLVYPLLRRFTDQGWVTKKSEGGDRGQTRQVYSLTPAGKRALIGRLSEFSEKDARSDGGFRARVGMFGLVDPAARKRILAARERALRERESRLAAVSSEMDLGPYGSEVVSFMTCQIRSELEWIARISKTVAPRKGARAKKTDARE